MWIQLNVYKGCYNESCMLKVVDGQMPFLCLVKITANYTLGAEVSSTFVDQSEQSRKVEETCLQGRKTNKN